MHVAPISNRPLAQPLAHGSSDRTQTSRAASPAGGAPNPASPPRYAPTPHSSTAAVVGLAKFYLRSPDRLTQREVEAYLVHLAEERKLAWNTRSLVTNGLRFFYHTTLGRKRMDFAIPLPKAPAKLPEILSREEVARILRARET